MKLKAKISDLNEEMKLKAKISDLNEVENVTN
jgi:hypothetical protein